MPWAGIAHDRLGDQVAVVREQLGGWDTLVLSNAIIWAVVNPSISHQLGYNHLPMAHRVEYGPSDPELFWTAL